MKDLEKREKEELQYAEMTELKGITAEDFAKAVREELDRVTKSIAGPICNDG